jgi:hypothetical protein
MIARSSRSIVRFPNAVRSVMTPPESWKNAYVEVRRSQQESDEEKQWKCWEYNDALKRQKEKRYYVRRNRGLFGPAHYAQRVWRAIGYARGSRGRWGTRLGGQSMYRYMFPHAQVGWK